MLQPNPALSELKDRLIGALVGLARAFYADTTLTLKDETKMLVTEALFASSPQSSVDETALLELIARVHDEKAILAPDCAVCGSPCGKTADFDLRLLNEKNIFSDENARGLKALILCGIHQLAASLFFAESVSGLSAHLPFELFFRSLFAIGEDWLAEELLPTAVEIGSLLSIQKH